MVTFRQVVVDKVIDPAMTSLVKTNRLRTGLDFTPTYTVEDGILAYLNDVRKREDIPLEPR